MSIIILSKENYEKEVIKSKQPVLIDFYADWCNPCKMLAPAVEAASEKHTDVNFYRLNIDNAMDIARKFRVMSIPTLIVFENGEEVNKSIGLISGDELEDLLR
jgi:thioredoxin 1